MDGDRQVQVGIDAGGEPVTAALTWGQQAIWKPIQWYGDQSSYFNMATMCELPDGTELAALLDVLRRLTEAHQGLRTHYVNSDDGPRQQVQPAGTLTVELRDCEREQLEETAAGLFDELRLRCFDHAREWPVRFGVVRVAGQPLRLVIVASHVCLDSRSMRLVTDEITAMLEGKPADPGPEDRWQAVDEANYQQTPAGSRRSAAALDFWQRTLTSMPHTMFDFAPAPPATPRFQSLGLKSAALAVAADRLATAGRISTSSVLLAGAAVALATISGRDSSALQLIVGNRHDDLRQRLLAPTSQNGMFHIDLGDGDFAGLARRCYRGGLDAYRFGYYDTAALDEMIASTGLQQGVRHDLAAYFNDIRGGQDRWDEIDGATFTRADVERLREQGEEVVIGAWDVQDCKFFFNVDRAPGQCLISVLTDTAYVPSPMAVLRGVENLLIEAAYRPVALAEAADLTGLRPAVRGEDWWPIESGWIRPQAMVEVLRAAAGTQDVAVFRAADGRLLAFVVGDGEVDALHRRVVELLEDRTDAVAPHQYHLCPRRPEAGDDLDAWSAVGVTRSGSGRIDG
ncbi:condensation domain-containing protein [Micromonospora sp. NPDC047074]|uniref:condensation domain-containing protein n=1 Tax=Micromonospora sp. NPDC047074 TaxID=3154339 RepID=UPI0033C2A2CC